MTRTNQISEIVRRSLAAALIGSVALVALASPVNAQLPAVPGVPGVPAPGLGGVPDVGVPAPGIPTPGIPAPSVPDAELPDASSSSGARTQFGGGSATINGRSVEACADGHADTSAVDDAKSQVPDVPVEAPALPVAAPALPKPHAGGDGCISADADDLSGGASASGQAAGLGLPLPLDAGLPSGASASGDASFADGGLSLSGLVDGGAVTHAFSETVDALKAFWGHIPRLF